MFNNTNILNDTTVLTTRYGWTTWLDNTIPGEFPGGPGALGFDSSFQNALDPIGQNLFPAIEFAGNIGIEDIGKDAKTLGRRWNAPVAFIGGISSTSYNSSTFGRLKQQVGFMRIWQISFRLTY